MKCIDVKNIIDQYLDGELPPARVRAFESHCKECALCAKELTHSRKVRKALKALPMMNAPKDFEAKVHARISGKKRSKFAKIFFYPRHIKIPLEVAALFVIALLVTIHPDSLMLGEKIVKEAQEPGLQMKFDRGDEIQSYAANKSAPTAPKAERKKKAEGFAFKDKAADDSKTADAGLALPANEIEAAKGAASESALRSADRDEKQSHEETAGAAPAQTQSMKKAAVARGPESSRPISASSANQIIQKAGGSIVESIPSTDGSSVTIRFILPLEKLAKLLEDFSASGIAVKSSPVIGAKNVIRIELFTGKK